MTLVACREFKVGHPGFLSQDAGEVLNRVIIVNNEDLDLGLYRLSRPFGAVKLI